MAGTELRRSGAEQVGRVWTANREPPLSRTQGNPGLATAFFDA